MITKRRKLIAIILLAVIGGVIAYSLLRRDDEPTYEGRRLSEWLELCRLRSLGGPPGALAAKVAVQNIGTNALPCLLKWIGYEPSARRMTLREKLPTFITNSRVVHRWLSEDEAYSRAEYASLGFWILGTNAASAIPALEALMNDITKPSSSPRAIDALGLIGEPAIPVLKAALFDPKQLFPERFLYAFSAMASIHGTNKCLPIVLEMLSHKDPSVRSHATNVVQMLDPKAFSDTVR